MNPVVERLTSSVFDPVSTRLEHGAKIAERHTIADPDDVLQLVLGMCATFEKEFLAQVQQWPPSDDGPMKNAIRRVCGAEGGISG